MKRVAQTFLVIVACCLLTAQAQLSWPPQFTVGQVWQVEIDSIGFWEVEIDSQQRFSETYVFGGESKTGTDKRNLGLFFEKTIDAVFVFLIVPNSNDKNYACVATRAGNPRGNLIYATTAKLISQNPLKSVNLKLECRMRLLKNVSTIAVPVTDRKSVV